MQNWSYIFYTIAGRRAGSSPILILVQTVFAARKEKPFCSSTFKVRHTFKVVAESLSGSQVCDTIAKSGIFKLVVNIVHIAIHARANALACCKRNLQHTLSFHFLPVKYFPSWLRKLNGLTELTTGDFAFQLSVPKNKRKKKPVSSKKNMLYPITRSL